MVEKIKKIMKGDLASRENSSGAIDEDAIDEYLRSSDTASSSAASSTQEVVLELIIKEPQTSGSILPAKDQENESVERKWRVLKSMDDCILSA